MADKPKKQASKPKGPSQGDRIAALEKRVARYETAIDRIVCWMEAQPGSPDAQARHLRALRHILYGGG